MSHFREYATAGGRRWSFVVDAHRSGEARRQIERRGFRSRAEAELACAQYLERRPAEWQLREFPLDAMDRALLIAEHDGCCAACGGSDQLAVDHDHDSGLVRGILCRACNTGLGLLGDSPQRLLALIGYLQLHALKHREADMRHRERAMYERIDKLLGGSSTRHAESPHNPTTVDA